jgi:hypothetical protein
MVEWWGRPGQRGARTDDLASLEDTQPLIPGYPTRRDVVRFAKELLDSKTTPPRPPAEGDDSPAA